MVAKVHEIEWFEGGAINVDDFVTFWSLCDNRDIVYNIKPETLKGFFASWKRFEEDLLNRATGNWLKTVKDRYNGVFKPLEEYVNSLE